MANIPEQYETYQKLLMDSRDIIDNTYVPVINEYMSSYLSSYPLFNPVGKYGYDSLKIETISDSYMKFVSNYKYAINRNMLQDNETVFDILYEPHFK